MNWNPGSVAWNNANNDDATFGLLSSNASAALTQNITVNSLTFGNGTGINNISGNFTLTVTSGSISTNRSTTITSNIAGSNGLTKVGGGTLTLFGSNSYTGGTSIQGGVLSARALGALPTATSVAISSGASLDVRASQTISGLTGSGTVTQLNTTGTTTLTVNPDGASAPADSVFSGNIRDGDATHILALTKAGSHMLTLEGVNTYTGVTTVASGSLLIGAGGSLTSAVMVNSGTFGGAGSTSNNVTIGNGAGGHDSTLAAGIGVGTFTTSGALTLNSDAVYAFELNGAMGSADKIAASGVTIDSAALFSFSLVGGTSGLTVNQTFTIIDNTGVGSISGGFQNLVAGGTFDAGSGLTFAVSGGAGNYGNDLILTVATVPEPATVTLAGLGLIVLFFRRRRS